MAEGSLATATNASPRPVARAPSPILRKVPEAVPARCSPSVNCARAGAAASDATSTARPAAAASRDAARRAGLEVVIKREPPLRRRPVVGRVVHLGLLDEIVDVEHRRVVLAHAPHPATAGDAVDAVDDAGAE